MAYGEQAYQIAAEYLAGEYTDNTEEEVAIVAQAVQSALEGALDDVRAMRTMRGKV